MTIPKYYRTIVSVVTALLLVAVPTALFLFYSSSVALDMSNRSLRVSSAIPGAVVSHTIGLSLPTTNVVGSLVFEYCENSPLFTLSCTAPVGFSATGATLTTQTLNTGFTVDVPNSTINKVVITRAPVAGVLGSSNYVFNGITNVPTANKTVFLRVSSHASIDGSGPLIDQGAFAYSTGSSSFSVGVFVPPYLAFCVGVTVEADCSDTNGSLITFGEFSRSATRFSTTQFAVATNDLLGYNVYVNGTTMTSGNNVITALSSPSGSAVGTSQFGMNLRSNSNPSVGANTSGIGTGLPSASYNNTNSFKFADGDLIAGSAISSDFNRFTASYIVNVSSSQPPGVYSSTLSYSAVVSF